MSATARIRRPVVVLSARRAAVDQAQRLGVVGVLENHVTSAIRRGDIQHWCGIGKTTAVFLHEYRVIVIVERTRSPLTNRKVWRPIEAKPFELPPAAKDAA